MKSWILLDRKIEVATESFVEEALKIKRDVKPYQPILLKYDFLKAFITKWDIEEPVEHYIPILFIQQPGAWLPCHSDRKTQREGYLDEFYSFNILLNNVVDHSTLWYEEPTNGLIYVDIKHETTKTQTNLMFPNPGNWFKGNITDFETYAEFKELSIQYTKSQTPVDGLTMVKNELYLININQFHAARNDDTTPRLVLSFRPKVTLEKYKRLLNDSTTNN